MAKEHAPRDGEPESTAIGAAGEKRIEDAFTKFLGDAATGIADIEAELFGVCCLKI